MVIIFFFIRSKFFFYSNTLGDFFTHGKYARNRRNFLFGRKLHLLNKWKYARTKQIYEKCIQLKMKNASNFKGRFRKTIGTKQWKKHTHTHASEKRKIEIRKKSTINRSHSIFGQYLNMNAIYHPYILHEHTHTIYLQTHAESFSVIKSAKGKSFSQ